MCCRFSTRNVLFSERLLFTQVTACSIRCVKPLRSAAGQKSLPAAAFFRQGLAYRCKTMLPSPLSFTARFIKEVSLSTPKARLGTARMQQLLYLRIVHILLCHDRYAAINEARLGRRLFSKCIQHLHNPLIAHLIGVLHD